MNKKVILLLLAGVALVAFTRKKSGSVEIEDPEGSFDTPPIRNATDGIAPVKGELAAGEYIPWDEVPPVKSGYDTPDRLPPYKGYTQGQGYAIAGPRGKTKGGFGFTI